MNIRKATQVDLSLVRSLAFEIWPHTYGNILSPMQLNYMLQQMYALDVLQGQIEQGHHFFILEDSTKAYGFAAFSCADDIGSIFKLHKIYLLPETQGKGLGRELIEFVMKQVQQLGGKSLLLNVNRRNNARFFYEKVGFKIIEEVDVSIGEGYFMNDYVMQKSL